jgi:hypothetical protein
MGHKLLYLNEMELNKFFTGRAGSTRTYYLLLFQDFVVALSVTVLTAGDLIQVDSGDKSLTMLIPGFTNISSNSSHY